MQALLNQLWSDWRFGLAAAVVLAGAAGLVSAGLTPRGPLTAQQVLVSIVGAFAVGLLAGLAFGSRWSLLVTPLSFLLVFELARMGVSGPTVDSIHLGSIYGLIAFFVGRFFHGLLVLLPMMLGALYGSWLSGRLGNEPAMTLGAFGWVLTGLFTLGLVVLAIALIRPGRTAPIYGPDGQSLPGSIAELTTVQLGGGEQTVMIRGRSSNNPVLLYLAGGPGGTDLGAMRADVSLEQDFIVVTWDQRGTGKSYAALNPSETLSPESMVADTIELTNYLRQRFSAEKIYLVANSWGTILGVQAVQTHPELYHAFIGTGQMVNPRETDRMFYEDTLTWAEQTGNTSLAEELRENGSPPYANLLDYELALSHEHDWNPYPELDPSKELPFNLFVPENSLLDRFNAMRGFLDTFSVLYPQLQEIDFRQDAQQLDIPVYIVLGKHEARGRSVLAREWFEDLEAPSKELIIFEHSGHRPLFEEPAEFAELMRQVLNKSSSREPVSGKP